ncbi:MAG: ParB/RepB/Spo0J family partition protein [Candidatus Riflebacteria bacterium]|nr:ParB/RepB/Spo0J family partition protein [Candidatus Riflebacteria bacterium]
MTIPKKAGAEAADPGAIAQQADGLQERLEGARKLSIDRLQPNPDQPRRTIGQDGIEDLKASIESTGIIEPLIVRPHGDGFQIICGERRYLASKALGTRKCP